MIYSFSKKNRVGDHICYISDISKFRKHYPKWRLKYSLKDIIKQIIQEIKNDYFGKRIIHCILKGLPSDKIKYFSSSVKLSKIL